LDFDEIHDSFLGYRDQLAPFVDNTIAIVDRALRNNEKVLFEGAQGSLLDIDHGTYPFVTSSNTVSGGICTGVGVGPTFIDRVIGITKAYTTRVGGGPFPSEDDSDAGKHLAEKGAEFGATTGRARRCGWLDLVLLRQAIAANGITELALTKLDILTGLKTVRLCIGYELNGETITELTPRPEVLAKCKPIYEDFPGWDDDLTGCRKVSQLPKAAEKLVLRIEEYCQVPVALISVGPDRDDTIEIIPPFS